ncbi:MAG TPA: hypothetical protein VG870_12990 [Chitinophagaceae bacterium]|nr:hypothetical protein [Chitinophagaceae bacterium]
MKRALNISFIILFFLGVIAYLSKPSDTKCRTRITEELTKRGYLVSIYIQRDNNNQIKGLVDDLTIKDRLVYKDIYYYFQGEEKKIAVAAIGRIFLIN